MLSHLPGVGPARAAALEKKGLRTVADALSFLPIRYEDRRRVTTIRSAPWAGPAVVVARCTSVEIRRARFRKVLDATFADETGALDAVWFNFYPSLRARLEKPPRQFVLSGEIKRGFRGRRQMAHPDLEELPEEQEGPAEASLSFGRIVPVYSEVEGFYQKPLRRLMKRVVDTYAGAAADLLPPALCERHHLLPLSAALRDVHFPPPDAPLEPLNTFTSEPHHRLVFDELFFLQLGLALRRRGVKIEPGHAFDTAPRIVERALARLPFQLTRAQRRAVDEILRDMARPEPMNRLLQGDVGSGKTAVALMAALVAVANKKQVAIMAPTEILAEQHARTFARLLAGTGLEPPLLTASLKGKEAERVRAALASGATSIAVGTHALLSEGVDFADLGLVIVDEQHRFGVLQRMQLIQKGRRPDVMVMTATPIPRTLAMTLYGDLDTSVIDELPPGRTPVTTKVWSINKREQVYEAVKKELRLGRQAYVVLPLVEESEAEELAGVRDATRVYEELAHGPLAEHKLGLVHGRLPARDRDQVMEAFRAGAIEALVATTVIEVGVDVPNATVMVVEHAERFGLSQLHQLRGRVGRGAAKSWCHLVADYAQSAKARERLQAMARTQDGFKIAEVDLSIRGPGEFLGTRQSGLPDLTVANLGRDQRILQEAREEAFALVERDPTLSAPESRALGEAVRARWAGRLSVGRVG